MRCIGLYTERKYNPQGGSIPRISLPRVASYRRQPWAIKSTTPMGLRRHQPLITAPQHRDGGRNGHLPSRHNMGCDHTIPWNCVPHAHYHHTTTWGVTTSPRGIARRSRLFLVLLGGKLDVAGVVFQNLLAQGCRVDMRINLCG